MHDPHGEGEKRAYLYSHVKALFWKTFSTSGTPLVILQSWRIIPPIGNSISTIQYKRKIQKSDMYTYFASIGLIGIPGTIDKVDDENAISSFMSEGTSKSYPQSIIS